MLHRELDSLAILLCDVENDLTLSSILQHVIETLGPHPIARTDAIVVALLGKGKWNHSLLLQVGLVDAREGLAEDNSGAKVARLESGVLARRTFAVVVLSNDHPRLSFLLPLVRKLGDGVLAAVNIISDVDFIGLGVDGGEEGVVREVLEVTLVLEPGAGGGDGVGCALSLDLDEDSHVKFSLPIWWEWIERSETGRGGRDDDISVWGGF